MSGKKLFPVIAIGVADHEHKVLRNIFKLSQHRPRSYDLVENASANPQIAIVDLDGQNAQAHWQELRVRIPDIALVKVGPQPLNGESYAVRRPFVATRVLGMLDQVATNELHYVPEINIGEDSAPPVDDLVSKAVPHVVSVEPAATHTALVVDDSLPVRKQIEIELKMLGVAADFAESGEKAFEFIGTRPYDIIFLDVVLPGVDGYRICKTIKKNKQQKHTPVVMLTSKSSPFDRIRGTFAGCNTYLTKPVAHDAFQKVVKRYLEAG